MCLQTTAVTQSDRDDLEEQVRTLLFCSLPGGVPGFEPDGDLSHLTDNELRALLGEPLVPPSAEHVASPSISS